MARYLESTLISLLPNILAAALTGLLATSAYAASHREAPLIA
jgi:hypothetical protein